MTKNDFILKLRRSLAGKLGSEEISEAASYYEEYIEIHVRKGQKEEQVVELLGDPALLAKSILNAEYDKKLRLNDTTLFSLGTKLKSVCAAFWGNWEAGPKAGLKNFISDSFLNENACCLAKPSDRRFLGSINN